MEFDAKKALLSAMAKKGVRTARAVADMCHPNLHYGSVKSVLNGANDRPSLLTLSTLAKAFDMELSNFIKLGERDDD